jgi:hypothetical protein
MSFVARLRRRGWPTAAAFASSLVTSNPKQYDEDDQNDTDAAVTKSVAVAANHAPRPSGRACFMTFEMDFRAKKKAAGDYFGGP